MMLSEVIQWDGAIKRTFTEKSVISISSPIHL